MSRILCWFSCGAASAVATKLMIAENNGKMPLVIAYTEVKNEHPDNRRFLAECEKWFGQEIVVLRNESHNADTHTVFRRQRFIVGPHGAPCTNLLKRQVRLFFEEEDDIQVLGYTVDEQHRADRFRANNAYATVRTPLIDAGLTKPDVLAIVQDAGIELPAMYKLGYLNNNCIGCVKGGMGYWNKIRRDFPEQFAEMAKIEREIGHSVNSDENGPVYLDELDQNRGKYSDEPDIECSIFCHMANDTIRNFESVKDIKK